MAQINFAYLRRTVCEVQLLTVKWNKYLLHSKLLKYSKTYVFQLWWTEKDCKFNYLEAFSLILGWLPTPIAQIQASVVRVVNPRTFFICKYYSLTDDWWVRKELDGRQHLEALLTIFLVDHIGNCTTWHFQTAKDHWRWTKNHHQPISNCCQHGERFWVGVRYSFDNTYETSGENETTCRSFLFITFP